MNINDTPSKGITIKVKAKDESVLITDSGLVIHRQGKPVSIQQPEIGFVYLLVDCSGSMGIMGKLEQAKSGSLKFAKDALSNRYKVGLISFGTDAFPVCETVRDLKTLELHINTLNLSGSTNMAAAITLAQQKLTNSKGFLVMVIITDGEPDSHEDTLAAADKAKKNNIDIITIGTDDADENFLSMLTSRSDLVKMVTRNNLANGIASAAKLLPKPRTIDR